MHPVSDHALFVRVVDRKGLTAAGRELRMSTAVVSSRIAKLEQRLGHKLLVRNTRAVSMTQEGRVYYEFCQQVLAEEAVLDRRLGALAAQPSGPLTISAPTTIGRSIVAPFAASFQTSHADVEVRLQITDALVNVIDEGIDIAVRTGPLEPSRLMCVSLANDMQIVCGAPAYFERAGVPQTPDALSQHNCLMLRFPGSKRYFWRFQHAGGDNKNLMVSGTLDSNCSDTLLRWALAGHGLIMASIWDVYESLLASTLAPALLDYAPEGQTISAVMPPRSPQPAKTTAFIVDLRAKLKDEPAAEVADKPALLDRFSAHTLA
ncbi:MAG: LysR family transcriptional regulator [Pseudomonadota bacterium]